MFYVSAIRIKNGNGKIVHEMKCSNNSYNASTQYFETCTPRPAIPSYQFFCTGDSQKSERKSPR